MSPLMACVLNGSVLCILSHTGRIGGADKRPRPGPPLAAIRNPYTLGVELFRDIHDCWNTGRFGKAYEECDDLEARGARDMQFSLGREKIFEVRRLYNDVTFIDAFFTEHFCHRHKLFVYAREEPKQAWVIQSCEFAEVKKMILDSLTNRGQPVIRVVDGNFENRRDLLLVYRHEGAAPRRHSACHSFAGRPGLLLV